MLDEEMERTMKLHRAYQKWLSEGKPDMKIVKIAMSDVVAEEVLILLEMEKNEKGTI